MAVCDLGGFRMRGQTLQYRISMPHKYTDYSLGVRLRVITGNLIAPFAHHDQLYYSDQLRNMLISVFKFKDYEVSVELMEMLAFGKNKYKNLQLEELISYLLEKYAGEKGILKYSKTKKYSYEQEKLMVRDEFVETINLGLNFIEDRDLNSDNNEFGKLFDQVANYPLQTITHKEYFQFLKEYLGSESPMVVNPTEHAIELQSEEIIPEQLNSQITQQPKTEVNTDKVVISSDVHRSGLQQLRDLLVSEVRYKCSQLDSDMDQKLTRQQTFVFFYQILLLEKHSIEYILDKYFNFVHKNTVTFAEIVEVIGEVHFREILTTMIKQETNIENTNKILMDNSYFKKKVVEACFFFKNKPTHALLDRVFRELVAKSQLAALNIICLQDFRAYILAFVCNRRLIFRQYSKKHTIAANVPLSIAEVSNSNFEEDSEYSEMRPRQFELQINQSKIQGKSIDQRLQNQSKYSVNSKYSANKMSGLSIVNRENSGITPFSQNRNPFEVSIKQIEYGDQQKKQVKTFINYMLTPQKNKQPPQFISIERESLQKEEDLELKYEKVELKEELWNGLDLRFRKYASNHEKLGRDEAAEFMRNELKFTNKFHDFDKKLLAFFSNRKDAPFQAFLSYTVHLLGQQGLFDFNRSQIKGKFTLNEEQLCEIIKRAYGQLNNLSDEMCLALARKLIKQRGKGKFTYSNWLQVVKNKLSVY